MKADTIKRMLDACYEAKRIREQLPELPEGVKPVYIQYIDKIHGLQQEQDHVKVSDISDILKLPRPGVTRTVKEMVEKGYLQKYASEEDGRITYIRITQKGEELSEKYDKNYYDRLAKYMDHITEEEAAVLEELPPQAASRPAAPTTPVTFMKSRREIALLIFVLLLKMIKNIVLHGGSAHTPLYTIMITKGGQKRKTQIVVMQLKNVQILLCFPRRI